MTGTVIFSPLLPWPLLAGFAAIALAGIALALWRGLAGWAFLGDRLKPLAVAGLILGVGAMRETKRTGQDGYGLALAGTIIGGLVTAFMVLGLLLWIGVLASGLTA